MSDYKRNVDDWDYCAMPCGAATTACLIGTYVRRAVRRNVAEQRFARILEVGEAGLVECSASGSVLVFGIAVAGATFVPNSYTGRR